MALTFELREPTALASRGWQFHIRFDQKNPKLALSAHKVSAIGREPSGDDPRILSQPLSVPPDGLLPFRLPIA